MQFRIRGTLAVLVATAVALTGCSSDPEEQTGGQQVDQQAGQDRSLKGVCPDKVVLQTNWWPQAEYGALYRLIGEKPKIDKKLKRITGRLVDDGADTGVSIEIRSGGPANNFTPAAAMLYTDKDVLLGGVDIDQAAQFSADKPVLAVFAPLDISPVILMWDPSRHADWQTIADIGQTNEKVLYFQGATYMEYLVGSGILRRSQVDPSYDGTPSLFVAADGKAAQQGYLTNEVYSYENEIPQWKKPVAWSLVSDSGYPVYPETLAIRPDRKAELAPCLKRLVPAMQRSAAKYLTDPKPTNDLIVRLVQDFDAFAYTPERGEYAVKAMRDHGIMGNGGNRTIGEFDPTRVKKIIDIVRPIFAGQKKPIRTGLTADDLVTNEFIDTGVGAGTS